jgi:hypothetical protein
LVFLATKEYHMNVSVIALAIVSAAALSPVVSEASPRTDSVNACAREFASSMAVAGASAPRYKLDYHGGRLSGSIAGYFPTGDVFDLEARNSTGMVIARARCSTNSSGAIVAFSPMPLGDKSMMTSSRR